MGRFITAVIVFVSLVSWVHTVRHRPPPRRSHMAAPVRTPSQRIASRTLNVGQYQRPHRRRQRQQERRKSRRRQPARMTGRSAYNTSSFLDYDYNNYHDYDVNSLDYENHVIPATRPSRPHKPSNFGRRNSYDYSPSTYSHFDRHQVQNQDEYPDDHCKIFKHHL